MTTPKTSEGFSIAESRWLKPSPRTILQHACGKSILVGEHAVVYGAKAIALPVRSQKIQFCLSPLKNQTSQLFLNGDRAPHHVETIVDEAFSVIGVEPHPIKIEGQSNLPIGAGLGSSACLCVAILRTITEAIGLDIDNAKLASFANMLERRFHGNPSGLDTAVVAHEKIILFQRGSTQPTIEVLSTIGENETDRYQPQWHFALIDSLERASTKDMIERAKPYFNSSEQVKIIGDFNTIADDAVVALENNRPSLVADCMKRSALHLKEAGVMTPRLEQIMAFCDSLGCLAAKPTGAGGGGIVMALLDPSAVNEQFDAIKAQYQSDHVYELSLPAKH